MSSTRILSICAFPRLLGCAPNSVSDEIVDIQIGATAEPTRHGSYGFDRLFPWHSFCTFAPTLLM
jgi:hypothetical protein